MDPRARTLIAYAGVIGAFAWLLRGLGLEAARAELLRVLEHRQRHLLIAAVERWSARCGGVAHPIGLLLHHMAAGWRAAENR